MKKKEEKQINIFKIIAYIIIGSCLIYNTIFLLSKTIAQKDYITIFGITVFYMDNQLMEDDLFKNELVVVKSVNEKELQEGDIIAYTVNGKTRINKIINAENDSYTTKSNKNYYLDIEKIEYSQIIGKKILNIRFLGTIIKILQSSSLGIVICLYFIIAYVDTNHKEKRRKKRDNLLKNTTVKN